MRAQVEAYGHEIEVDGHEIEADIGEMDAGRREIDTDGDEHSRPRDGDLSGATPGYRSELEVNRPELEAVSAGGEVARSAVLSTGSAPVLSGQPDRTSWRRPPARGYRILQIER